MHIMHRARRATKSRQPVRGSDAQQLPAGHEVRWQWATARGGWVKFDPESTSRIEAAYGSGEPSVDITAGGNGYRVDLESSLQWRLDDPDRRRQVRREIVRVHPCVCIRCETTYTVEIVPDAPEPDNDLCGPCLEE
jgi:hypothetical protein